MKIRIKGNFIRYRLTQSEVKTLAETGYLEEETNFRAGQKFGYALAAQEGISGLQASFENGKITMFIPVGFAKNWFDEERVGFENEVEVVPGVSLKLLLEKDFVCLDASEEDQSDNFPNPNSVCGA
jgi:hypothetical protein